MPKRPCTLTPAVFSLVTLLSACGGPARSPTAVSPLPTAAPSNDTYILSGVVSEETRQGPIPVEGARVEEASGHRFAMTDLSGFYSIPGVPPSSNFVTVTKSGFVTGRRPVMIGGDTKLDLRLDRIAAYTLSGIVFEVTEDGPTPIEGVEVYCDSCGSPEGHTFVYTDSAGFYSFAWTTNGSNPLLVRKAGYVLVDPTGTLRDAIGRVNVTVDGDTTFDIQLARR